MASFCVDDGIVTLGSATRLGIPDAGQHVGDRVRKAHVRLLMFAGCCLVKPEVLNWPEILA